MTGWEVSGGVALDLVLGDPRWMPHPVRGIGWLISRLEQWLRPAGIPLRAAGIVLCASTVAITTGLVWITLPWANVYWVYSLLALRSLDSESMAVVTQLRVGDLPAARLALSGIVGRDTEQLEEPEIIRAVLETVSENLSDGVIAPLFYLAILGPVGMAAYKAVNTLDSMVGYKNERYRELGWASARLDDLLNYIPSRVAAMLVWMAALLTGLNVRRSIHVTFRDGSSQPSPNSGWPEAAFAGALGVRLGGENFYQGVASRKAYLGEPIRSLSLDVIPQARRLLYVSSLLMIALVIAWK